MAILLNVLGLSIALAAFILIMIQVRYDHDFNHNISGSENIFRMELISEDGKGQASISRPLSERFFQTSPHIQAGALANGLIRQSMLSVERSGSEAFFKENFTSVTPSFAKVFPFSMVEGDENSLEQPDYLLIPESMAKRMYEEGPYVGKQIKAQEKICTIGGVYRDFPDNCSLGNSAYISMGDENVDNQHNYNYNVYVRLDNPASAEIVMKNFENIKDESWKLETWLGKVDIRLTSFQDLHYTKEIQYDDTEKASRQTIFVLIAIAFILLIIAAINYTNFSMALTPMRVKSINTQKVMGAADTLLRKALLGETFVICIISFFLSLGIVHLFSKSTFSSLVSETILLGNHLDLIAFTFGITLLIALCAGLYPSFYVTSFPPALVLKGNFGLSSKGRYLRNGLLCFQYIASFTLIIGASFMYLQNHFMQNSPLGYEKDELIVANLNPKLTENREALKNDWMNYAGVKSVTFAQFVLSGGDHYMHWSVGHRGQTVSFDSFPVTPGFLETIGIEVTEGRDFREEDQKLKFGTIILNERAKHAYNLEVGMKFGGETEDEGLEIIGFMPDIKFTSFRKEIMPMAFVVTSMGYPMNTAYIKVAAGSSLHESITHVREVMNRFDKGYPFEVRFFDDILQNLYTKERKMTLLITLFSIIAIFISIVGVFGLVIFESQYKQKEIGLRKVMGSTTGQILLLFNKIYIKILLACFIVAAPVAYLMIKNWLENFAYRTPMYWWVYLLAFLGVAIITVFTVTFQNSRAANANPVESIKSE